jgi:uncharacterized protein YndB with AHSA1/START domain
MPYKMQGKSQIRRTAVIRADVTSIWSILADSKLLPQWVPAVQHVDACQASGESYGSVRRCRVKLGGRAGTMVERCVHIAPPHSIAYVVDEDSFGMRKMFDHYGFRISLEPQRPDATRVTIETTYTPKNLLYAILNAALMRPKFRRVVDQLLHGLGRLAESTSTTEAAIAP